MVTVTLRRPAKDTPGLFSENAPVEQVKLRIHFNELKWQFVLELRRECLPIPLLDWALTTA